MRVGELARRTGYDLETIPYPEKSGLLEKPSRDENAYRADAAQVERPRFIRRCLSLQ